MGGDLEQLWYTWTTYGLDSGRGFQVRAASARFHDKRDRALWAALRYCYRPPGERAFGWIELDGHRMVFNRVDAGRHNVAGGGNFFVHLILGSAADLPASSLWSLYEAPFWQTRDPGGDDLFLPVLRVDERGPAEAEDGAGAVPEAEAVPEDESDVDNRLAGFLAFLLHCIERRSGMQVALAPDVAARLASAAAAAVPDEFGLVSFSTSEHGSNAREYDIVCSDDKLPSFRSYAGPEDAADLPTLTAAQTLLDTSAASRALVETIAAGPGDRRDFVRNLVTTVTYREGGQVSTDTVVNLVSARPEALNAMLDSTGMTNFAGQLARGEHTALAVLPRLNDDLQRRAARRVARAFADDPTRALGLLRTTARHSPCFTRETARELLSRANGDGLLSEFRWADTADFIKVLAGSGAKLTAFAEQLLTEPRVAAAVAIHSSLPTDWRVAAAIRAPAAFSAGRLDRALAEDVEFAGRYLRHHGDEPISANVERITRQLDPGSALTWLQAVGRYVSTKHTDRARWIAIDRIANPDELLRRLYEHSRGLQTLEPADWESRLRRGLIGSTRSAARSSAPRTIRRWTDELDMLARLRPRSAAAQAWKEILDSCERLLAPHAPRGQHLRVLTTRVLSLRGEDRQAAGLLVLERTCYAATELPAFGMTVKNVRKAFGNVDDVEWVRAVVFSAARLPGGPVGDRAAGVVGLWALHALDSLGYRPKRDGGLRSDFETIANRMSGPEQERLRKYIGLERFRLGTKRRNRDRAK